MFNNVSHQSFIRNMLVWAFATLVAIAVAQFNTLAGLTIAVIGGVILGILLFVK